MSLILNIDTSLETAFINIADKGVPLGSLYNMEQKEHAAFLQKGIKELCLQLAVRLSSLSAIAVTSGPGSYTGLRVGMSGAKGICYSLKKPFITIGTLNMIAKSAANLMKVQQIQASWIVPMIDARRMEVFTSVFNEQMEERIAPRALILDSFSFLEELEKQKISFCGNGAGKFQSMINHPNAFFLDPGDNNLALSQLSFQKFSQSFFTDLADSQPTYVKEYYTLPI